VTVLFSSILTHPLVISSPVLTLCNPSIWFTIVNFILNCKFLHKCCIYGYLFYVCRHEGAPHPHSQQQTQQQLQQQLQPGGMNTPEGRCGTPPATGSPDRLDKATLKVHLPNGGFNVVKFGDAIDVKVRSRRQLLARSHLMLLGFIL
jgi:hypothetical protein